MRALAIIASALIAGCASTAQDVKTSGARFNGSFQRDADSLAQCMQRNAERESGVHADVRPIGASGREVVVRGPIVSPAFETGVLAVFELTPEELLKGMKRTSAKGWIGRDVGDADSYGRALLQNCN